MRSHIPAAIAVILSVLGSQTVAWGQQIPRSSTSSGLFGSRTVGSGASAGSRTFGGTGAGGLSTASQGNVGQIDTSDRFVRGSRRPGQFVGTSSEEAQTFLGAIQAGANALGQSGLGPLSTGSRNANRGAGGRTARTRNEIRTSLRVAFEYPRMAAVPQQGRKVLDRLVASQRIRALSPVQVVVHDGTAILQGVVATEHDRGVAERLILLEAGIWDVQNELVVAQAPADSEPSIPAAPAPEGSSAVQPGTAAPGTAAPEPATEEGPAVVSPLSSTPPPPKGDSPPAN